MAAGWGRYSHQLLRIVRARGAWHRAPESKWTPG